jgi:threonine dehydrogenase-like Zn-dependent dehydrogenase
VRIRVEAFGLNRSELKLRLGLSAGVSFPRVPGIEAAGTVDAAPAGSGLARGQKVVAMMGDMGRTYDGGYAEYTSVPLSQVIPVDTELAWEVLGGLPEMVQTVCGSLTIGLDLKPGQSVLIRGGASSVGLAAAALAAWRGATVLSTTRRADRLAVLTEHGVDYLLLDTGQVAPAVRELYPDGVDAAFDLAGTPTLLAAGLFGGLCAVGVCWLSATADRAHDDLDREAEDDEVSDYLPGDHEPRRLGLGRDVAEPDRGEHGDGEIQPVGVRQRPVEVGGRHPGHDDVAAGEQQQEQRNAGGQGFDGPQAREG